MTTTSVRARRARPSVAIELPRRWRETVVPAELPNLAREIIKRIRADVPEYRRAMDGPYGRSMRESTEKALLGFMTQFFRTGELSTESEQFFRDLGRAEALEGRAADVLQTAYRAGALAAWHRIVAVMEREPLPADLVGRLGEAIFGFADSLARLSMEGYAGAQRGDAEVTARLRTRLARLIISQPDAPPEAIRELAERLGWELPERLAVVDVLLDVAFPSESDLTAGGRFGSGSLVVWEQSARFVVLPGPIELGPLEGAVETVEGMQLSVGCTVPLAEAAQSLRWARLATRLRGEGLLPAECLTICDEHVPDLLVQAEPAVVDLLAQRRLQPLLDLPLARRLKFGKLLAAWLEYGGSQAELAETLSTHRQTLHYRIGRLQAMFGDQLHDADARVEMVLALRALLPRWEIEDEPA